MLLLYTTIITSNARVQKGGARARSVEATGMPKGIARGTPFGTRLVSALVAAVSNETRWYGRDKRVRLKSKAVR